MKIGLPAALMSHQVMLPPLNDPATEFVVEHYYVDVSTPVAVGQAVALVRSERFAWDVPATIDGIISALLVEPGGTVAPGAALIELTDQQPTTNNQRPTTNDEQPTTNDDEQQPTIEAQHRDVVSTAAAQRMRATPVARRMIADHGLDPAELIGTGRGTVITRADVLAVLANREQGTGTGHPLGVVPGEQGTALSTQHSVPTLQSSNVPYALTAIEVDLAAALATTNQHAALWARRGVTLTATACVAAVTVGALREHPLLHSAWRDDGIILRSRVQLAIEHHITGEHRRTLIPHAADLNAGGIARRLAHAAHHEEIEQQAATFVIVKHAAPWWAHALPDGTCAAQLSVGAIMQQPRVVATAHGDQIMVRPTVVLTLAYDARVATQNEADALLRAIKRRLEHLHSL